MVEAGTASLKDYFERSRKWEQDAYLSALRSLRFWRVCAIVALIVSFASVLAVTALAPLKTVEPFVVRVDNSTGIVETMSALQDAPETYDEAIGRYFIGQYIRSREGFVYDEAGYNFRVVALMSDTQIQEQFAAYYNASNPTAPQNVYGRRTTVSVLIRSISFINENVAQVRYVREEQTDTAVAQSQWITTLTFQFLDTSISTNDRLINPLGFQVLEYRTAEEVL